MGHGAPINCKNLVAYRGPMPPGKGEKMDICPATWGGVGPLFASAARFTLSSPHGGGALPLPLPVAGAARSPGRGHRPHTLKSAYSSPINPGAGGPFALAAVAYQIINVPGVVPGGLSGAAVAAIRGAFNHRGPWIPGKGCSNWGRPHARGGGP